MPRRSSSPRAALSAATRSNAASAASHAPAPKSMRPSVLCRPMRSGPSPAGRRASAASATCRAAAMSPRLFSVFASALASAGRALGGVEAVSSTLVSSSRAAAGSPATWPSMSAMTSAARSGPSASAHSRVWRTRASRAGTDGVSGVAAAGSAAGASQRPKACCSQPGSSPRSSSPRSPKSDTMRVTLGGTVTRASSRTSHDNPTAVAASACKPR